MEQGSELRSKRSAGISYALILLAVCLVIWAGLGAVVFLRFKTWDDRGKVGDMFGVANSLFSGLALAGIVTTLLLQREQLEIQRQELAVTQKELSDAEVASRNAELLMKVQVDAIAHAALLTGITTLIGVYNQRLRVARDPAVGTPALEAEYSMRLENLTLQLQQLAEGAITK
jgi:hypothetical protein